MQGNCLHASVMGHSSLGGIGSEHATLPLSVTHPYRLETLRLLQKKMRVM